MLTGLDAPRYRHGLIIAASCAIAAAVVILVWKVLYRLFDGKDQGIRVIASVEPGHSRTEGSEMA